MTWNSPAAASEAGVPVWGDKVLGWKATLSKRPLCWGGTVIGSPMFVGALSQERCASPGPGRTQKEEGVGSRKIQLKGEAKEIFQVRARRDLGVPALL